MINLPRIWRGDGCGIGLEAEGYQVGEDMGTGAAAHGIAHCC
jgi:hypothetical protein